MKLTIEKSPTGNVRLSYAREQSNVPVTMELEPAQVELFITMLGVAQRSQRFLFSFDVEAR